ncbi:peptidase S8/S53 subtilisin kexin sedolisin [Actinoplanes friuliensis DSM 7358]|uniref:Peptidase S8/S53 subtilisin kexin sedolisin n=1 Tax=Actinoplanes friuliensis DSM 7358 TaxID=1246995 RepID=U5WA29_9ACTN|nr:peptidase S8/S53 subtilisin kexin sedolisin [Actinoplanes friuliensis DSM 7358]
MREQQWFWGPLKVAQAQKISKGEGITVGLLDTGVDGTHPDLKGAVLPGRQVAQDKPSGNLDVNGHGTGMAGVIAGRGHGSNDGVLGIAPAAKIMPIRPVNDPVLVAQGIRWAVENGAKVINMSFATRDSESLHAAVQEAIAADVVLVATAGNDGDTDNVAEFPGGYPEVLAVGAVDRNNKVAKFSNHGKHVDLVAPGVEIPGPAPGGKYQRGNGTSGAAAIVAGSAALIRAEHPELSATEVMDRLTSTAIDRGDKGRDDYYGVGQLDLLAALTAEQPAAKPSQSSKPVETATAPEKAEETGIPPLVIVGAGLVLLLAVGLVVGLLAARSRRAGG